MTIISDNVARLFNAGNTMRQPGSEAVIEQGTEFDMAVRVASFESETDSKFWGAVRQNYESIAGDDLDLSLHDLQVFSDSLSPAQQEALGLTRGPGLMEIIGGLFS